jgi:hypothetical protein
MSPYIDIILSYTHIQVLHNFGNTSIHASLSIERNGIITQLLYSHANIPQLQSIQTL